MRRYKNFIILLAVLPWISVPFLGNKTLKRFLPGTLFITVYVTIEGWLAEKNKWWWFFHKKNPNMLGEVPLILGPFVVGTFWTLKLTYGNFKNYFITNLVVDSFFTYVMVYIFKKIGYVSLVRLNRFRLSLLFLIKSLALYGFQYGYELLKEKQTSSK
jgi:hypothetical protein